MLIIDLDDPFCPLDPPRNVYVATCILLGYHSVQPGISPVQVHRGRVECLFLWMLDLFPHYYYRGVANEELEEEGLGISLCRQLGKFSLYILFTTVLLYEHRYPDFQITCT